MNIHLFYHSLLSDWNHGNAHFLRGITTELLKRGHNVEVYEPRNGWSYSNWVRQNGKRAVREFQKAYPHLKSHFYDDKEDFDKILADSDLVIVHEWTDAKIIRMLGRLKKKHNYHLLFHDTHHRSATSPEDIEKMELEFYDGVLAFGEVVKDIYLKNSWTEKAWTWHEAADTTVFKPIENVPEKGDLVWIGNWGDDERTEELVEYLIEPARKLNLKAKMYGVLYPDDALRLLRKSGIEYGGYLPSHQVPEIMSAYSCTVHIPRRAYAKTLPGIPTIRPFEAMACGIPLLSSPWLDRENLFREGKDFVMVQNGSEMTRRVEELLNEPAKAQSFSIHGLETIQGNHTCSLRADELMRIYSELSGRSEKMEPNNLSINQI